MSDDTPCTTWELPVDETQGEAQRKSDRRDVGQKIIRIMEEVGGYIQKKGKNEFHKYKYVMEADVMDLVGKACLKHGLVIVPRTIRTKMEKMEALGSAKPFLLTTVKVVYDFIDTDTGSSLSVEMEGQGADNQDKGIYKAITGATKYALMKTLLLSSGDDPEQETGHTGITPHSDALAPNTLLDGVILGYTKKSGDAPHQIRIALEDGDMMFTQHRLPCTETLLTSCQGQQVQFAYRKQGKFSELTDIIPASVVKEDPVGLADELADELIPTNDWHHGVITAYGTKGGISKAGKPWTRHSIELMEDGGQKHRTSTFSLSRLAEHDDGIIDHTRTPQARPWNGEDIEQAIANRWHVTFFYEEEGKFKNLLRLQLVADLSDRPDAEAMDTMNINSDVRQARPWNGEEGEPT